MGWWEEDGERKWLGGEGGGEGVRGVVVVVVGGCGPNLWSRGSVLSLCRLVKCVAEVHMHKDLAKENTDQQLYLEEEEVERE